jgi:pimeloyl-ACP methyl ester carboxylesterase
VVAGKRAEQSAGEFSENYSCKPQCLLRRPDELEVKGSMSLLTSEVENGSTAESKKESVMAARSRAKRAACWVRKRVVAACAILLFGLVLGFGAPDGLARDLGSEKVTAYLRGVPITVYTYRPTGCSDPALLFIFHGIGRNPSSYEKAARNLADRKCMVVFAPLFDKERFPVWRYQRGGIIQDRKLIPREEWTVWMVADLVTWARLEERRFNAPYYLFGHSAGAQFLSRVAAFSLPKDAMRIVIANPSTYVLPSTDEPAPYGLGGVFSPAEAERQLRAYLQLPITIFLGEDDTGDEHLAQGTAASRQGDNRLERGELAFEMASSIAKAKGWDFRWRIVKVPDAGHSARGLLNADEATEAFAASEPEVAH